MAEHTVSTLLFVRLFVEKEGHGRLMASVHPGLKELADRVVAEEPDLYGFVVRDVVKQVNKRLVFRLDPDLWGVQEDLRNVPRQVWLRGQEVLQEVLGRIAASGWRTRPLLPEELAFLQDCVPGGNWAPGITVVGSV